MAVDKVEIVNLNEVYVKVNCPDHIAYELRDKFTFKVPGYQFTPKYKARMWDGNIRLFNIRDKTIYRGLVEDVEEFCEKRGYNFSYDYGKESKLRTETFFANLKLPFDPREHQVVAIKHCYENDRSVIVSPTASGKSLMIYCLVRSYIDDARVLIIVPTTSLVEQLYKDFQSYSTKNGWDVEKYCHRLYSGRDKSSDKKIIISTWQTLHTMPRNYFNAFNVVIGDECHLFKAKSLSGIMEKLTEAKYRFGFTGTLDGSKTHELVLKGLFGPVKKVITTKELMDQNHVAQFDVKCLLLKYPEEICKASRKLTYQQEIEYLISNDARNKILCNLALMLEGNTLVLFNYVEKHGDRIMSTFNKKIDNNRPLFYIHGKKDTEEREQVREIVEKETNAIIVASYGTFSTGINIKNLHNVIFASPSKSRIRNLQSIGRSLRISDSKTSATLYDVADDLVYKKHENYTFKHFMERLKIYSEEKFGFKIYKIDLKG